jgi:methyl-accepting chemotaxis protein
VKNFKNWTILTKIMSISIFTIVLIVSGMMFYFIPLVGKKLMEEKETSIKSVVDVVLTLAATYDARAKAGQFTQEEAQSKILSDIKGLRYQNNEYFFVFSTNGKMVAHGVKQALVGKDMADDVFKDSHGKFFLKEMVEVSKDKGEGFVDYMWPKPNKTEPSPKLSYVKLFAPWGWIIGTGIYVDNVQAEISALRNKIMIATGAGSGIILVMIYFIASMITKPLKRCAKLAGFLAQGDFSGKDLNVSSMDEAGILARALDKMKNNLNDLLNTTMRNVSNSSLQVASASEELSMTVKSMVERLDDQTKRVSQIATASEEMSQTVLDIAQNTNKIANSATETSALAKEGEEIVKRSMAEVKEIADTVDMSADIVRTLGDRSTHIGDIVNAIEDIADQTNLLALNAAIEAARAGEHGRGFAVVADEVRKLAERSVKSTTEIRDMIKSTQDEVFKAIDSMENVSSKVSVGVELSAQTGKALSVIVDKAHDLQLNVQQIASATEEMSTTSGEISKDIEAVAMVSRESSDGAMEIERASTELSRLSADLKEVVEQFKL